MQDIQKITDAELVEAVVKKMCPSTEDGLSFLLINQLTNSLAENHYAVRIVLEAALKAERGKG